MAIKISKEDFINRFGDEAFSNQPANSNGFLSGAKQDISNAFHSSLDYAKQGYKEARNIESSNPITGLIKGTEGALKAGAGIVGAAFSPLAPATKYIKPAVEYATNPITNMPAVQKFSTSKVGDYAARSLEDLSNAGAIAGTVAGVMKAPKATTAVGTAVEDTTKAALAKTNKAVEPIKAVTKDVIPTTERIINHQVTQALDLTASDVKNINLSTGNEVGRFLADKNLIGSNKNTTVNNLNKFFKENYDLVRSEINKVNTEYKPSQIPRYTDALKAIQTKTKEVAGLEKVGVEIENLLSKRTGIKLKDVQKVKELMDEHFKLYKATGDVGESVAKQGLDNIRKDLKGFIEKEVKNNTGSDIAELNNNVSTAKSTLDAIEERSTAGLTRSNIRIGDFGTFGVGTMFGGPVTGIAAVFLKKLAESPAIQLRIAKLLDSFSDARKAKIQATLQKGKIPPEFNQFIKKKN